MRILLLAICFVALSFACSGDDDPPPPTATPTAAPTSTAVPSSTPSRTPTVTPTPDVRRRPTELKDILIDVRDATTRELPVMRQFFTPVFARQGAALWTYTEDGMALLDLDGNVLEELPGAWGVQEDVTSSVRAYATDGGTWLIEQDDQRVTELPGNVYPSIGGEWIAFTRPSTIPERMDVVVLDLATGIEQTVFAGKAPCHCDGPLAGFLEWSSSGRYLAFMDYNLVTPDPAKDYERAVFVYDRDAATIQHVDGFVAEPAWSRPPWSPLGDFLLVRPDPGAAVQAFDASTGELIPLVLDAQSATFLGSGLVGSELFGTHAAVMRIADRVELAAWPSSGVESSFGISEGTPVFATSNKPDPSAACNGVLYFHPTQPADGTCIEGASSPSWSPDGSSLAFLRGDTVAVLDVMSGVERAVYRYSQVPQFVVTLVWSADGTHLLAPGYMLGL